MSLVKYDKGFRQKGLVLFLVIGFVLFGFFLKRTDFFLFYLLLVACFGVYYKLISESIDLRILFITGLVLRLILLFATPELSDDFYRFLWDGALLVNGENPFMFLPNEVVEQKLISKEYLDLFPFLNSPNYYTVYPTIIQLVNIVSVFVGQSVFGSFLVMKLIFLGFELASFYFLRKLLTYYQKDENQVFWYWLCPLIILEFVGNLHHEAIMITFVLGALFFLKKQKRGWSAIFLALAIFTKLTPLLFVSFFVFSISKNKVFGYVSTLFVSSVLLFLPMIYQDGYLYLFKSIQLYFGSFEFNSSFYYLSTYVSWVLPEFKWLYKLLVVLIMGFYFMYWNKKKVELAQGIAIVYLIYVFTAQSVHPWYILPLFPLFLMSKTPSYYWTWLILIPLTYITYITIPYQQNVWVNLVEYGVVFSLIVMKIGYVVKKMG